LHVENRQTYTFKQEKSGKIRKNQEKSGNKNKTLKWK